MRWRTPHVRDSDVDKLIVLFSAARTQVSSHNQDRAPRTHDNTTLDS